MNVRSDEIISVCKAMAMLCFVVNLVCKGSPLSWAYHIRFYLENSLNDMSTRVTGSSLFFVSSGPLNFVFTTENVITTETLWNLHTSMRDFLQRGGVPATIKRCSSTVEIAVILGSGDDSGKRRFRFLIMKPSQFCFRRIFIPATVSANRVPTLSSSGEKQIWSEPEDHQPRSSDKVQLSRGSGWLEGVSTDVSSKRVKKIYKQGIIDYNGKNSLEDRRSLYNSMNGSLSFDVTLRQFNENLQTMIKKYTTTKNDRVNKLLLRILINKTSMKTSLFEDSLRWAHVPTSQPHRTSTAPDELVTGNHVFPLSYCRIDPVPWWVMYSSLLLQTVSTVSPFDPSLVGPFIDSNAGSSEDGFVSSPSRPVVSTQGSDEYNRLPVGVPSSSRGGVRGPSFPSDLNLIFWASSSIWAFPDVLGLNLNISYIVKCLHHQCPIRQFSPTYSSILVFSVPKTIMYSERKISSTILPSRSPSSVITGSIEIHLVSRINIVGGRADISGRYPKIIFSEITDGDTVVCLLDYLSSSSCTSVQTHSLGCINVVYDYSKLVGAFNSGIKVKIIQGFLHIEQASPTNIISSVLMYSLLFILSSTMALVLSKAIWGAEGIAFQSANGKSKESKKRVTKKRELVSSRNATNA
ncbi:LOW QUALITY PROTEIN: hypothetical protein HID58_056078 [Brassica napus]|uniref:Uncharacterized protein n=1 Tax=Brassica napus TaxID=3708 RepID=A0ABQ8AM82_BRANA|nr:LOW QUALITY PROTEIN: hypothetical protein HID58_056078 [Brassica napus]